MSHSSQEPPSPPPSSDGPPPASRRGTAFLYRIAEWQIHRPWTVLSMAAVLVAISLALALRLEVRPGFESLLPESRPSVQELDRVKHRSGGVSTVFVLLEGDDTAALRRAADAIVIEARKIGSPWVSTAESGVHRAIDFMQPRTGLFADLPKLRQLRDDVVARYEYEVGKVTGAALDEEEDDPDAPPKITADSIKKRFGLDDEDTDRFPGGYYQSKDGKAVVVTIRSGVLGTDFANGTIALGRIRAAIERADPKRQHPSIRHGLAGDLVSALNEYAAINEDLTDVGLLGALLIVGVVFLYYLRVRTLLSMLVTIGIGVSCTFGVTELLIGQLNMATGFLFTIIAGNGINPGIIYMARYLEARRAGIRSAVAVRVAHRETWLPTLTASCAASAAYSSLLVTEFRGFRDFGIIGGVGMVLCWLCTFAFLPSVLVAAEQVAPLERSGSGLFGLLPRATAGGTRFGAPFAALVARAPRVCTVLGVLVTIGGVWLTVRWIRHDPMEYDMRNLETDMSKRAEEMRVRAKSVDITAHIGADGMAILTDRVEQVPLLTRELERRRDQAAADAKPFKAVHTLQDFVPSDQAAKIPLLLEIKDRVMRARKRGIIKDDDFAKVEKFLPPDDLKPFGIDDLPDDVARAFTERDGSRGRVVYIEPLSTHHVDDARYLFRWAGSYRRTELPDGSVVLGSGRAVIYADIWAAVIDDVPRAVLVSLLVTLVVVALAFRTTFAAGTVISSLLAGVACMTGMLAVGGVRLNFLNFIALPITFGIGVDYAVNVMQRYRREGAGGALVAIRETGGAVVLCSATTVLGYLALISSVNYAVRSLGVAAVIGEIACLLAAVIVLPAVLVWRDGARGRTAPERKTVASPA